MTLEILNGNTEKIPHLSYTKYYKALQDNISCQKDIKFDESHVEFLEAMSSIKAEVDAWLTKNYCLQKSRLEDAKLFQIIWHTSSQLLRAPERQNSVNEVIRVNLKSIGKISAQMVKSVNTSEQPNFKALLLQVKSNDSMLTHLLKALTDTKLVKGTFLC